MKIYIMSGLPGSGKDWWIKNNLPADTIVCSADDYFMVDGEYKFDPTKLGLAHKRCFAKFVDAGVLVYYDMSRGIIDDEPTVIAVSNTNLTAWEISPYVAMGNYWGVETEIIRLDVPIETCIARNQHNVPANQMERMAKNLQYNPLPKSWKVTKVNNG